MAERADGAPGSEAAGAAEAGQRRAPQSRAVTVATWALYVLIAGSFAWFATTLEWSELRDVAVRWEFIAASLVFGMTFRYFAVWVWKRILVSLGARELPPFRVLAGVYSRAWMGRYVPGKVAWIGGKILFAAQHGVPKSKLAVSSVVEAGAQVLAIALASLTVLAIDGRLSDVAPALQWLAVAAVVALLLALVPPVFNWLMRLAMSVIRRGTATPVSWSTQAQAVALFGVGFVLTGMSDAMLVYAVAPSVGAGDLVFLLGAFGLAGVLGMVVLVAPSGLGVRDGVQAALLSVLLTGPVIVVIVLLSRVLTAVMDVAFWGAADGWHALSARRARAAAGDAR